QLLLPDGKILRSGDVLTGSGGILPREAVGSQLTRTSTAEKQALENLKLQLTRFKNDLFEHYYWPMDKIIESSPIAVHERDPDEQFRTWLRIWDPSSTIWIGEVFSSGRPEHRTHFRPISEWYQIGPVLGNFTCGSPFRP